MEKHNQSKIAFVVTTGEEANLIYPLYQQLLRKDGVDVINIGTGRISCESNSELPEEAMKRLGMVSLHLADFRTKSMVEILKKVNPDVVVAGSDQEYIRRAFLYAGSGLGISTLLLQLGISENTLNCPSVAIKRTVYRLRYYCLNILHKYFYMLRTVIDLKWSLWQIAKMIYKDVLVAFTKDDARGSFICQTIAVAGMWEKRILVERGVNPNNICITGNPKLGLLSKARMQQDKIKLRQKLGIDKQDKVILLLTCAQVEHGRWNYDMCSEFIDGVIDSVAPFLADNVHFVIKIHPVESLERYQEILKPRKERIILHKRLGVADIINASDVVMVGGYSMAVLEASTFYKPVLLLNMFNEIKALPYAEMGLAIELYKYGELRNVVGKLLYNRQTRERLQKKAKLFWELNKEYVDGKAGKRIVDLIMTLAQKHKARQV